MEDDRPRAIETTLEQSKTFVATQAVKLAVLALLLIGCFVVVRPFLAALMWSVFLCFSTWPIYSRLVRVLQGRRTVAAFLMTVGTILVLLAPFILIGASLTEDVRQFASNARHMLESPPAEPPSWVGRLPLVGSRAGEKWREVVTDRAQWTSRIRSYIEPATSWILQATVQFMSGLAQLALSILVAFFLFRDGGTAAQRLVQVTENLAGMEGRSLIDEAGKTVRGVVYGILGTALAQGVVAGIGFVIAGIPGAGLLALLTFFLSVLPVGPPLIWIPATIWLFNKGEVNWAIFMACWGLLVSSIDNVIKPLIISQGSRMPFILVFLGIVGGAIAFGFLGVFLGPTLLAVGYWLLEHWKSEVAEHKNTSSNEQPNPSAIAQKTEGLGS